MQRSLQDKMLCNTEGVWQEGHEGELYVCDSRLWPSTTSYDANQNNISHGVCSQGASCVLKGVWFQSLSHSNWTTPWFGWRPIETTSPAGREPHLASLVCIHSNSREQVWICPWFHNEKCVINHLTPNYVESPMWPIFIMENSENNTLNISLLAFNWILIQTIQLIATNFLYLTDLLIIFCNIV